MYECKLCLDDIPKESKVMYKLDNNNEYIDFDYCIDCLDNLMEQQWSKYINGLKTADCEKSLLLLIQRGPPIRFRDACINNNQEIYEFYHDGNIKSSKLDLPLEESQIYELHKRLSDIITESNNINSIVSGYDYLGNIATLLKEYNL